MHVLRNNHDTIYKANDWEDNEIKPFLKWAGGKRQQLANIKRLIPHDVDIYFEPFVGAGAVFLDYAPKTAVISDTNTQLIDSYIAIKDDPDKLIAILNKHAEHDNKDYFYKIREMDRSDNFEKLSPAERAARLIYLNKTCYNGLYRVNRKGQFNVPYGRYKNALIYEDNNIKKISEYLNASNISFSDDDFAKASENATDRSFVYMDPPYYYEGNGNFTNYQADGFGKDEHLRLHEHICRLTKKGVRCLLSNSDSEFVRELYAGFEIEVVQASRPINRDAKGRGKISEILIRNYSLT